MGAVNKIISGDPSISKKLTYLPTHLPHLGASSESSYLQPARIQLTDNSQRTSHVHLTGTRPRDPLLNPLMTHKEHPCVNAVKICGPLSWALPVHMNFRPSDRIGGYPVRLPFAKHACMVSFQVSELELRCKIVRVHSKGFLTL